MYIAPNTDIYILHNIPLGKDYENTVYYKNAAAQEAAFIKYMKFHLTEYSYQRQQLGTIRVELKYEQLYDCNYLMFKNSSFENKWFYCFITGIGYVNDNVTEIYYEMDVMQTWCYDYQFLDSFVERRNTTTDRLYSIYYAQPEGLEIGSNYKVVNQGVIPVKLYACLLMSKDIDSSVTIPSGIFKYSVPFVPNSLAFYVADVEENSIGIMNNLLISLLSAGQAQNIISVYLSPAPRLTGASTQGTINLPRSLNGGYIPRNYKLYYYPYHKYVITNKQGATLEFRPEILNSDHISYQLESVHYPYGSIRLVPTNYRVFPSDIDGSLTIGNIPAGAASSDAYQTWLAQNKNSYQAAINAAFKNYDTNLAIAQSDYNIANRSAQAGAAQQRNSANTALANATATNNTALATAQNSFNTASGINMVQGAAGTVRGLFNLDFGNAATSVLDAATRQAQMNSDLQNSQMQVNTAQGNAANTAGTVLANTGIALSTAMKNSAESLAAAQLSGLTTRENTVEALTAKKRDIENYPASVVTLGNGDMMNLANGDMNFTWAEMSIDQAQLHILDDYFDVYGYALRSRQTASALNDRLNQRPHHCFLKTAGANIKGKLNAADLATIKGIYDNGIITWDTLENIGNFELNNEAKH